MYTLTINFTVIEELLHSQVLNRRHLNVRSHTKHRTEDCYSYELELSLWRPHWMKSPHRSWLSWSTPLRLRRCKREKRKVTVSNDIPQLFSTKQSLGPQEQGNPISENPSSMPLTCQRSLPQAALGSYMPS
jgi:hypothetical protein